MEQDVVFDHLALPHHSTQAMKISDIVGIDNMREMAAPKRPSYPYCTGLRTEQRRIGVLLNLDGAVRGTTNACVQVPILTHDAQPWTLVKMRAGDFINYSFLNQPQWVPCEGWGAKVFDYVKTDNAWRGVQSE